MNLAALLQPEKLSSNVFLNESPIFWIAFICNDFCFFYWRLLL